LFTVKTCPRSAAPKNGALACHRDGSDHFCVVMCKNGFDFVFNPPMLYFCSAGQWQFYALPGQSYSRQLPWPDCSSKPILLLLLTVSKGILKRKITNCKLVDVVYTKFVGLERQNYQALDILNSIIVLTDDGDLFFSDLSFIHVFLNLMKHSIKYYIWLDFGQNETRLIMFWLSFRHRKPVLLQSVWISRLFLWWWCKWS